jgi:hypothetical protein
LSEVFKPATMVKMKESRFLEMKAEILKMVDSVASGLGSMSLSSVMLDTQGLIELYYNTYNPQTAANQKLVEVGQLRVER